MVTPVAPTITVSSAQAGTTAAGAGAGAAGAGAAGAAGAAASSGAAAAGQMGFVEANLSWATSTALGVGLGALAVGTSLYSAVSSAHAKKKSYKAQAEASYRNAQILERQSAMLMDSAKAYAKQARITASIGEENARLTRYRASFIQNSEDFTLAQSRAAARASVGSAKTSFAANGILLEDRSDSAVAIWEQDEVANSVIDRLNIMQQYEDEAYSYLTEAQNQLVQGYGGAAQYAGQAASSAADAVSASLQREQEIENWRRYLRMASKQHSTWGIVGTVTGAVAGALIAGPIGLAIGASLGGSTGMQFD